MRVIDLGYSWKEMRVKDSEVMDEERKYYLDVLRILATFGVIIIHSACRIIDNADVSVAVDSAEWFYGNLYDGLARFSVPMFIMISGALFLNRDISIKKIWEKYIKHLIIVFFVWTALYDIVARGTRSVTATIQWMFVGMGRFSFLLMMAALYIVYPLLKRITEDKALLRYFIFINLGYVLLITTVFPNVGKYIDGSALYVYFDCIYQWLERIPFLCVSWLLLCFITGYVLDTVQIGKRTQVLLELGGMAGAVFTVAMTYYDSMKAGTPVFDWMSYATINVFLQCVGIFVFVKYHPISLSERGLKLLSHISKYTLGVYLIHTYIVDYLLPNTFNIDVWSFWLPIAVFVLGSIVFVTSLLISWLLNHIPIINYLV